MIEIYGYSEKDEGCEQVSGNSGSKIAPGYAPAAPTSYNSPSRGGDLTVSH